MARLKSSHPDAAPPRPRPLARRSSTARGFSALAADADFARLDAIVPPFDPLEVLAWARRERPHTRFLAWLLDPHAPRPGGGHGLGAGVLQALVSRAVGAIETLPGLDADDLPRDPRPIDPATVTVVREQPVGDGVRVTARAPDVRVTWRDHDGTPWLLLVENKIDAAEGDGQVREYLAWARAHHPDARRLLLYVTPDGRAPVSRLDGEVVVTLGWPEVADAGLHALSLAHRGVDPEARAFVTSVLEALRARFGGREDARTLVEALHDRHPRAAALVASPALEPEALAPLRDRHPRAVWHLQTVRPRAHPWTRGWAEGVTRAFAALPAGEGRVEPWPALIPGAPHADCPDVASWSLGAITGCLGLYVLCTPGAALGSARPRLWLGLRAPGATAAEVFAARDQAAAVDALPAATRALLLGAAPVRETPATWRWLRAGAAVPLPRGWSAEDDARRVARAIAGMLSPHAAALATLAADPDQRLYSCDLDPDHGLPVDARDREALAAGACAGAERVVIAVRQPTGHMHERRRESDLGVALGAAFGGTGALAYGYTDEGVAGATAVVAATGIFRARPCAATDLAVARVREAVANGALLVLLGDRWDPTGARAHLGGWLGPVEPTPWVEEFPAGEAELWAEPGSTFEALCARDGRLVGGAACVTAGDGATVPLWFTARSGSRAGERFPLVAAWRAGGARVVFWAGGGYGPWGRALRQRPDALARWWRAVTALGRSV